MGIGICWLDCSSEHDGLRKDGYTSQVLNSDNLITSSSQPDQRVNTGAFAQGQVDPHEAGKKGGETGGSAGGQTSGSGGADYKPTENDGLRKDGQPDGEIVRYKFDTALLIYSQVVSKAIRSSSDVREYNA